MCVSISLDPPPEGCWVGSKVARCTRVQSNSPPRLWGVHEGTLPAQPQQEQDTPL